MPVTRINNLEQFEQFCINNPQARMRVVKTIGQAGDRAYIEAVTGTKISRAKDFLSHNLGDYFRSGRNFDAMQARLNYQVAQQLLDWRNEEGTQRYKKFGHGSYSIDKATARSDFNQDVLTLISVKTLPTNVGKVINGEELFNEALEGSQAVQEHVRTQINNQLACLKKWEKRVYAVENNMSEMTQWQVLLQNDTGSMSSLNLLDDNQRVKLIFKHDIDDEQFEQAQHSIALDNETVFKPNPQVSEVEEHIDQDKTHTMHKTMVAVAQKQHSQNIILTRTAPSASFNQVVETNKKTVDELIMAIKDYDEQLFSYAIPHINTQAIDFHLIEQLPSNHRELGNMSRDAYLDLNKAWQGCLTSLNRELQEIRGGISVGRYKGGIVNSKARVALREKESKIQNALDGLKFDQEFVRLIDAEFKKQNGLTEKTLLATTRTDANPIDHIDEFVQSQLTNYGISKLSRRQNEEVNKLLQASLWELMTNEDDQQIKSADDVQTVNHLKILMVKLDGVLKHATEQSEQIITQGASKNREFLLYKYSKLYSEADKLRKQMHARMKVLVGDLNETDKDRELRAHNSIVSVELQPLKQPEYAPSPVIGKKPNTHSQSRLPAFLQPSGVKDEEVDGLIEQMLNIPLPRKDIKDISQFINTTLAVLLSKADGTLIQDALEIQDLQLIVQLKSRMRNNISTYRESFRKGWTAERAKNNDISLIKYATFVHKARTVITLLENREKVLLERQQPVGVTPSPKEAPRLSTIASDEEVDAWHKVASDKDEDEDHSYVSQSLYVPSSPEKVDGEQSLSLTMHRAKKVVPAKPSSKSYMDILEAQKKASSLETNIISALKEKVETSTLATELEQSLAIGELKRVPDPKLYVLSPEESAPSTKLIQRTVDSIESFKKTYQKKAELSKKLLIETINQGVNGFYKENAHGFQELLPDVGERYAKFHASIKELAENFKNQHGLVLSLNKALAWHHAKDAQEIAKIQQHISEETTQASAKVAKDAEYINIFYSVTYDEDPNNNLPIFPSYLPTGLLSSEIEAYKQAFIDSQIAQGTVEAYIAVNKMINSENPAEELENYVTNLEAMTNTGEADQVTDF